MRVFELLLLASNIGWLVVMLISKKGRRSIPALSVGGIAALLLVLHLTLEGYRIQLLPLYATTIGASAVSLYLRVRSESRRKFPRFAAGSAYTAMTLMLLATAVMLYVFPVFRLPEPSGRFQVGTQAFHWIDEDREESFARTPKSKRELMVQVWYPAQADSRKHAPFIPTTRILRPMAANYGLPGFTFEYLRYVTSHSRTQAPAAAEQPAYPLILANPGFGSSRFLHTSQAEELASRGYIVAVIDHTYNTFATEFPDGRITTDATSALFSPDQSYAESSAARDRLGRVLTEDAEFVLDRFEQIQSGQIPSLLQGKIDLAHIGIFGHSIGGATAYDTAYDERIDAGIDLDGGLYRVHERGALQKPFLFLNSASEARRLQRILEDRPYTDTELTEMGSTREWEEQVAAGKKAELERMREAVDHGGQALYIDGTEHLNFTDAQFVSPVFKLLGATGSISPKRADAVIDAYMLDFFDTYLKGQKGELLRGTDSRFPEVRFLFEAPDSRETTD
ncbi:dienelactone hydrolase [Saccharibacillus sp. O23]|uniref:alpha/beta hydrolase family protein n=1 Tax=Saccharibacillus sp. O23 TaxID=2009338 RepID=UPI000B4DF43C|nr:dienelactone hydrolase [Saccharibacillus sp. O23]OWR27261.1 dienelactone hydrolase [Saccharibacillus sp. O23]